MVIAVQLINLLRLKFEGTNNYLTETLTEN